MEKIEVGILGATGMVGQKFVELLSHHPWFEITALCASEESVGKRYGDLVIGAPPKLREMAVSPCCPNLPCKILFSGLSSEVAKEIEEEMADAGYFVISNAASHRMDKEVPLLIPEVNSEHLSLIETQRFGKGAIITNPNCSVIGICLALKPLIDIWGLESVHVHTMQALSGAGNSGMLGIDILDNVIPYIAGEEEKIETEPLKIFNDPTLKISAQCSRVPVSNGHLASLSVKLKKPATKKAMIDAWTHFGAAPQLAQLPSAPARPTIYLKNESHPQPKLHRKLEKGMAVSIGRLRPCPLFDWKFTLLSHNTIRGAAGTALLNAELLVHKYLHKQPLEATSAEALLLR